VTSHEALIWDYNNSTGPTKSLALPLPPTIKGSEPLPLGAIVRNGPTNDFGVVVIAPSTGKIVFWENVDSAEARSHFPQRHQGVEGLIKVYSGECITDLVDVEHAGYMLVFSSGRLAQLTLRDTQGRPSINTTVLSAPNGSNGSFFSLKGLLGGAIRKTIASVKARPSESKGQMEVITATRNGLFHLWDLTWSGQQTFKREIDVRANVLYTMQQGTPPETRGQQDVHMLDFAIMEEQPIHGNGGILALVALSGRSMLDYFLLELDLSGTTGKVNRAIPLRNFHQAELPKEPVGTLLLPSPGHTALVQFSGAIVLASLTEPEESPEAQLFSDSGSSILPFQDCVYFKDDAHVQLVGHALEQSSRKDKRSSALVFVQDYGILQISAYRLLNVNVNDDDDNRRKVTALSKILQATFFSTIPGTILDFSTRARYSFSQAEVENAAAKISSAILSSSFEHFEKVTASLDEQLGKRAFALRTLNSHLRSEYPPLSFSARWQLLWHAEKLAAAQQLWKWFQGKLQDQQQHPESYPEKILMGDIVKALNEKYKTPLDPKKGETDPVRQFFLKDVDSLGILIPWGWNYLRLFYINSETKERSSVMQRLSEANDVFLITLETSFSFRQANIERYGLDPDAFQDGILKAGHGYDMLPHFWTSSHNIVSSIRSLVDVGRNLAEDNFEQGVEVELAQKVGKDNPRLVKIGCQTHIERFRWALEQSEEKTRETGRNLREEWKTNVRPTHIYGLMSIGLATDGMNLAELYQDMPTLAKLVWDETAWLEANKAKSQSKIEQAEITVRLNRIKERIARYFDQYGEKWAKAYFTKHIVENKSGQLLQKAAPYQKFLTDFLRSEPNHERLSWINEVIAEKDYEAAGLRLYTAAKGQETNAWCSKVELSLAKLAMLCKDEVKPDMPERQKLKSNDPQYLASKERNDQLRSLAYKHINTGLDHAKIQDLVYERLVPAITTSLDDETTVENLMKEFGQGRLAERPALQSLLRQGFDDLVHHRLMDPCLMIDVLTLMTYDEKAEPPADYLHSHEFAFALRILALNWDQIQRTTRTGLVGVIWKRLILKDDWARINDTKDISDQSLTDFLVGTHTGWTMKQFIQMCSKSRGVQLTC
jgi:nuclear pore complex protein Nup133